MVTLHDDVLHAIFKLLGPDYGLVLGLVCKDWHRVAAMAWGPLSLSYDAWKGFERPNKLAGCVDIPPCLPYRLFGDADFLLYLVDTGRAPLLKPHVDATRWFSGPFLEMMRKLIDCDNTDECKTGRLSLYGLGPGQDYQFAAIVEAIFNPKTIIIEATHIETVIIWTQ